MNELQKEKIRKCISPHLKDCMGREMTDAEWDDYFLKEYTPVFFIYEGDDLCAYKDVGSFIWIQDFCSENVMSGNRLIEKMISFGKVLKCQVPITNIRSINTIIRKGFRIKGLKGYNYILERQNYDKGDC